MGGALPVPAFAAVARRVFRRTGAGRWRELTGRFAVHPIPFATLLEFINGFRRALCQSLEVEASAGAIGDPAGMLALGVEEEPVEMLSAAHDPVSPSGVT